MVSLASKDLKPIHTFVKRFPYIFIAPLQLFVLTILLWQLVGVAALTGILYLVFIGLYLWATYQPLKRLRKETSRFTAVRLTQIENTINAIRLVKMSTWEEHFQGSIGNVRRFKVFLVDMFKENSARRFLSCGQGLQAFWPSLKPIIMFMLLVLLILRHLIPEYPITISR